MSAAPIPMPSSWTASEWSPAPTSPAADERGERRSTDRNLARGDEILDQDLQRGLGITTIYVTHDQSEALTMSDRIGVMSNGRVVQVGTPTEIYETLGHLFVTTFIRRIEPAGRDGAGEHCQIGRIGPGRRHSCTQRPPRAGLRAGQRAETGDPARRTCSSTGQRWLGQFRFAGGGRREDLSGRR